MNFYVKLRYNIQIRYGKI